MDKVKSIRYNEFNRNIKQPDVTGVRRFYFYYKEEISSSPLPLKFYINNKSISILQFPFRPCRRRSLHVS